MPSGVVPDGPKWFQAKKPKSMTFNYKSVLRYLVLAHELAYMIQLHKLASSSMILNAVPRACIQLHKLVCSTTSLHPVLWACIQSQVLACIFIKLLISLSEQLTRTSHCFNWLIWLIESL